MTIVVKIKVMWSRHEQARVGWDSRKTFWIPRWRIGQVNDTISSSFKWHHFIIILHVFTDNGAYYCYCNSFKDNPDRRYPMHEVIRNLTEYHRSLGLNITMYHLDSGFWHSAHADGHCDGVTASNWSASEFHWPSVSRLGDGLGKSATELNISFQM